MQAFAAQPPPLVEDELGVIRIAGSRVSLESVVIAFDRGASPEEIVDSFPTLDLAGVYATITYVLQNRPRVDEYLQRREAETERLRAEVEARFPADGFRARLEARRRRPAL